MASLQVGGWYVLRGRGPVELRGVEGDEFQLRTAHAEDLQLAIALSDDRLRPIVSKEQAEEAMAILTGQRAGAREIDGPDGTRAVKYRRCLRAGELVPLARALRDMYTSGPTDRPEREHLSGYEAAVYAELARVLGRSEKRLRADVRAAVLGEAQPRRFSAPDRTAELRRHDSIPTRPPLVVLGAIAIEDVIAVGEGLERELPARPGVWYVHYRPREEDDGDADLLLAVHCDHAARLDELQAEARETGWELPIHGASMCVADGWFADDPEFQRDLEYAGGDVVAGRAVKLNLGGDGAGRVRICLREDRAILVAIDF